MGEVNLIDVSKRFVLQVGKETQTVQALSRVSFTVRDGEIVSLIGRLVPQTVVSTGGQGTGLDSAAAILGALINNGGGATPELAGPSTKK